MAIKEFYPTGSVTRYAKHSEAVEATSAEGEILLEREREKFLNEARTMSRFSGESSIVHVKDFFLRELHGISIHIYKAIRKLVA